jgi:hypothetical protein
MANRGRNRTGRSRGRNLATHSSWNDQSSVGRPITHGYSQEEWRNLSPAQWNRIYRERVCIKTARMVTTMLRGYYGIANDVGQVFSRLRITMKYCTLSQARLSCRYLWS